MKCPKCGYISFDYSQVCAKCNRDISAEQQNLNLPDFKPEPPSLLGTLIGEVEESHAALRADENSASMEISMEEAVAAGAEGMDSEGKELEISLEPDIASPEALADIDFEEDTEEISLETDEITLEESPEPDISSEPDEGELSLDLDDLSLEEPGADDAVPEATTPDASGVPPETPPELAIEQDREPIPETDSVVLEVDESAEEEEQTEIELNLDDLKINETGELEIGKDFETLQEEEEGRPSEEPVMEAPAEEPIPEESEESLDLGDESVEEPSGETGEELELGDLAMDETPGEGEEDSLDFGDISLEEDISIEEVTEGEDEEIEVAETQYQEETGGEDLEQALDLGEEFDEESSRETGEELELGDLAMDETPGEGEEDSLDFGDIPLEEGISLEEDISFEEIAEGETMAADEQVPEEPAEEGSEEALELEDVSGEEPSEDFTFDEELDLGDISFDEPAEEENKGSEQEVTLSMDESALEELVKDDAQADSEQSVPADSGNQESFEPDDDEFTLDLEDLDLDLDLDDSEEENKE